MIAALGIFRLGIVPAPQELLRIVIWLLVTIIYVAFWLAFGLLLSVVIRRAATSALVGFGIWFLVVPFGRFLVTFILAFLAPTTNELSESNLAAINIHTFILRLLPTTLYREASTVLLNPQRDVRLDAADDRREHPGRCSRSRRSCRSTRACCSSGRTSSSCSR